MKGFSITNLGVIALLVTVPFVSQVPAVASVWQSTNAVAQNTNNKQQQLQLRLEAQKQVVVRDEQGKSKITWQALAGNVQPGDVLRYTLSGENTSNRPIKNLTLNQPVPKGTVYVPKSIKAPSNTKITYSIDGGRNFVENPTIKVTVNGKEEVKPAPASAYTHIRLQITSVPANATVTATYQTQVR
ncbi:hypothetical protein VB711_17380 [Cronbergia sp. UHCC 0137]|uniref:hypothetical protein n=1 Tax=Cronbergia sp. UHCC 0137 TaxID=3110239 RepID=UPI002B2154DC|nr:hypothetical protein [Cronbergia sp. UHCC 0137]MEA5619599.1 hypothetical protein [Cronbergia sp. UHCC 0137]